MKNIGLRKGTLDDAELLFEWRNHPQIIALSSHKKKVDWPEHLAWFRNCISEEHKHQIFFVMSKDTEIGVVRFDLRGTGRAVISVYLHPDWWGSGLGADAVRLAVARIIDLWRGLAVIEANVIVTNRRAVRVFEKCGFSKDSKRPDKSHTRLEFAVAANVGRDSST